MDANKRKQSKEGAMKGSEEDGKFLDKAAKEDLIEKMNGEFINCMKRFPLILGGYNSLFTTLEERRNGFNS